MPDSPPPPPKPHHQPRKRKKIRKKEQHQKHCSNNNIAQFQENQQSFLRFSLFLKVELIVCSHNLGSIIQNINQSSAGSNLPKNPEKSSNLNKSVAIVEKGSIILDDECKSEDGPTSSAEELWDATLQLSTAISVSVIAFFKSGVKMQDLNWSDSVEVKGKVRLEAFEKCYWSCYCFLLYVIGVVQIVSPTVSIWRKINNDTTDS